MKSAIDEDFMACFARLPPRVQQNARKNYRLWKANPSLPGLAFKPVSTNLSIYSIRIGAGWRALGLLDDDTIQWFWIGSHAEYDRLLKAL